MSKFISWFASFFNEENGASTTRALNWIWILILSFIIVFGTIKSGGKLPEIGNSYVLITTALLAAKVGQRVWGENSSSTSVTTPGGSVTTTYTPIIMAPLISSCSTGSSTPPVT